MHSKLITYDVNLRVIISNLLQCYKNGAVAVEFDLVLTADFVPVLFHDVTLDRVTNIVGEITEKLWSEVKELDISIKHPFQ